MNATRVILRFSKRKKCMEATLEEKPISKEDVESAPATNVSSLPTLNVRHFCSEVTMSVRLEI